MKSTNKNFFCYTDSCFFLLRLDVYVSFRLLIIINCLNNWKVSDPGHYSLHNHLWLFLTFHERPIVYYLSHVCLILANFCLENNQFRNMMSQSGFFTPLTYGKSVCCRIIPERIESPSYVFWRFWIYKKLFSFILYLNVDILTRLLTLTKTFSFLYWNLSSFSGTHYTKIFPWYDTSFFHKPLRGHLYVNESESLNWPSGVVNYNANS